jgi:hypothetical protein
VENKFLVLGRWWKNYATPSGLDGWGEILFFYKYVTPSGFLIYALSTIWREGKNQSFVFIILSSLRDF